MRTLTGLMALCTALIVGCSPASVQTVEITALPDSVAVQNDDTTTQQEPATEPETDSAAATPTVRRVDFISSWRLSTSESSLNNLVLISEFERGVTARVMQSETGCGWEATWHVSYTRDGRHCVDSAVWQVGRHMESMPDMTVIPQGGTAGNYLLYGISVGWEEHIAHDMEEAMNPNTRAGICF